MKKLMTLICALFCMTQVYAANPVKQWGQLQVKVRSFATRVVTL